MELMRPMMYAGSIRKYGEKNGNGMRNKILSTMYNDFVTHVIRKVK